MLVTQGSTGQWRSITWDQVGHAVGGFEILALIRLDALPNASGGGGVCATTADGFGYAGVFDSDGSPDSVRAVEINNGAVATDLAAFDVTLNMTSKFWVRLRITGGPSGIKCWEYGTPEPAFALGPVTISGDLAPDLERDRAAAVAEAR